MRLNPRTWSFRARQTIMTTCVFVLAGAGLLLTVYLVARHIVVASTVAVDYDPAVVPSGQPSETGVFQVPEGGPVSNAAAEKNALKLVALGSKMLGEDVLAGILGWSAVLLVVFTALTAVLSSWLSRRAMRRIREVTAVTQRITDKDLSGRLDLTGPNDEIKELGDTIDEMLARLEESFDARERFIANASHELRTPLTTTRLALEIPISQGRVDDQLRPALDRALAANRRSEELIASLLVLARGRAGIQELRESVDLGLLVGQVLGARSQLECEVVALVDEGVIVQLHRVLVEQAVGNLVDNAVRHNVPGGRVWVRGWVAGTTVVIEVENTGRELSAVQVARFVEPFHRGVRTRKALDRTEQTVSDTGKEVGPTAGRVAGPMVEGLGLGLSVVADVAAAHDGSLRLTRRAGGGVIARLVLAIGQPDCQLRARKVDHAE